ncbi:hypothetical protein ACFQ2H_36035 [Streptomyces violaceoruber]
MPTRAGSYRWTGSCSTPSTRRARPPSAASPAGPPAGPSPPPDWTASTGSRPRWPRWTGASPCRPVRRSPAGLGPLLHRRPHRPHRARPARRGPGAPLCRALALPALRAAADPDPLRAALGALFAAAVTHGTDYPGLFAEARRCFPGLRADASPQA